MAVFKVPFANTDSNYCVFGIIEKSDDDPTKVNRCEDPNAWTVDCSTGNLSADGRKT